MYLPTRPLGPIHLCLSRPSVFPVISPLRLIHSMLFFSRPTYVTIKPLPSCIWTSVRQSTRTSCRIAQFTKAYLIPYIWHRCYRRRISENALPISVTNCKLSYAPLGTGPYGVSTQGLPVQSVNTETIFLSAVFWKLHFTALAMVATL